MPVRNFPAARRGKPSGERAVGSPSREVPRPLDATDIAAIFILLCFFHPVAPFMPDMDNLKTVNELMAGAHASEESLFERLFWIPAYLTVVVLTAMYWQASLAALDKQRVLVALLALVFASTLWSIHPVDTLRRDFALLLTTLAGVVLGARYSILRLNHLLGWVLAIIIVASLADAVIAPNMATTSEGHPGAWRGVFTQKNSLGQVMLLASMTYTVAMVAKRRLSLWPMIGLGTALTLLFLSTAVTPIVVGVAMLPVVFIGWQYQKNPRRFNLILALALCSGLLAALLLVPPMALILRLLGKDATLTGRTEIWQLVWLTIQPRLWLGYGFAAFWLEVPSESNPVFAIWDALNWRSPNAHSGFLDLWLSVGLIGTILFAMLTFSVVHNCFRRVARASPAAFFWSISYFLFFLVYALSESNAMEQNSINWLLFVAMAVASRSSRSLKETARSLRPAPRSLLAARSLAYGAKRTR